MDEARLREIEKKNKSPNGYYGPARKFVKELITALQEAWRERDELQSYCNKAWDERDEALKGRLPNSSLHRIAQLERDEARAEVERLKKLYTDAAKETNDG